MQKEALIISGGNKEDVDENGDVNLNHIVEVFYPHKDIHCYLPQLTKEDSLLGTNGRATQDGLTLCDQSFCYLFQIDSGKWSDIPVIGKGRIGHVSWKQSAGVLLMGGDGDEFVSKTTSFVSNDLSTYADGSISLKYKTT